MKVEGGPEAAFEIRRLRPPLSLTSPHVCFDRRNTPYHEPKYGNGLDALDELIAYRLYCLRSCDYRLTMPFLGNTMETRNQAFQKLKPVCVGLSQATLALQGPRGDIPETTSRLENLQDAVATVAKSDQLDEKLADYVFFPLSQVLKLSQRVSIRCLELTLSVLAMLIGRGWRHHIQPQLAAQMLILCTLLASDKPTGLASAGTTVEIRTNALHCLQALFEVLGASKAGKELIQGESNVPQLGQTLSTVLDALLDVDDLATQTAAVDALDALVRNLDDREIMARFLPGTVSKLTKVLTPKTKQRRGHYVLVSCLRVVSELISSILSNDVANTYANGELKLGASGAGFKAAVIDADWLEAAATQMKPALVSIFRLSESERDDVRTALGQLCMMLLERCYQSLAGCAPIALDTLITLCTKPQSQALMSELEVMISAEMSKAAILQESLHDQLQSLARVMQSSNEDMKTEMLRRIQVSYDLLRRSNVPTQLAQRELLHALRDSMIITIQPVKPRDQPIHTIEPIQSLDLSVRSSDMTKLEFAPMIAKHRGQQEVVSSIETLIQSIACSATSTSSLTEIARSLRVSQGDTQVVNFWLLHVSTKAAMEQGNNIADLLTTGDGRNAVAQDALEDLYAFSLSVLNESSETPPDPRIQALALRSLALRAEVAGKDFRYELIDALYPVLHTLATPDPQLQQDSITTLNVFTQACAYRSTQDLIVSNVDYLTNAVALKLNAFDVSPQAPQVLLMMVRLAGPSLLPYLEDTIESIFAALEDFHGYPLLVELLFRVLSVVAEEGAKSPQLTITNEPVSEVMIHARERQKPIGIALLTELLREKVKDDAAQAKVLEQDREQHALPQKPWKPYDWDHETQDVEDEESTDSAGQVDEAPPPPVPKAYNLLRKITDLTQHFLPSASPSLRTSLLALIHTTSPALAKHENSFLPLINTLWPEVTARLDDSEANVQAAALHIIADLCENAKDFMRSRIVDLWPILVAVHQRVSKDIVAASTPSRPANESRHKSKPSKALVKDTKGFKQAVMRMQAAPADYSNTSLRLLWDALVRAIAVAVGCVALPPEKIDEALEMLAPVLGQRDVRQAFEEENADAVWLMNMRSGVGADMTRPVVPVAKSWQWAAVPG